MTVLYPIAMHVCMSRILYTTQNMISYWLRSIFRSLLLLVLYKIFLNISKHEISKVAKLICLIIENVKLYYSHIKFNIIKLGFKNSSIGMGDSGPK